jgi:hypothetical protein
MMEVTIIRAGFGRTPVNVPDNTTVGQLGDFVEINPGTELRVGGRKVDAGYVLRAGETVIGAPPVKGGIVA